jgi:hypothetical protein
MLRRHSVVPRSGRTSGDSAEGSADLSRAVPEGSFGYGGEVWCRES